MKKFFQSNYQHLIVLSLFMIIIFVYFSPQFSGMSVNQGDVTQYIGAANESYWFKDVTGQEQLWSNSMFGGMPTVQTTLVYPGNYIGRAVINFINWFPAPGGMVLLHLIGFYILLLCFKVNKWLAFIGAIAFSFSTYEVIILAAGHNSKSLAVAFLPMVLGGFYMAYRTKFWLGLGLSALFMTFELSSNHFQVTYYLGILLLFVGLSEFIRSYSKKTLSRFFKTSGGLLFVYFLALAVNYGNVSLTNEYAKKTIRGGNDLALNAQGEKDVKQTNGGLDKDYITTWSYGKGESFTFLSPYVKGGASEAFGNSPFVETAEKVAGENNYKRDELKSLLQYPSYWGEQPMTAGPFYMGVIMFFLAFVGMFFIKDGIKWPLLIVGILALMLSWGKNFMGFTEFWLDYIPGYNKFRTVTIILVLVELIIPLIGILFLDLIIKNREEVKLNKNKIIYSSVGFFAILLIVKLVGLDDGYTSQSFDGKQMGRIEQQITQQILTTDPIVLKTQYNLDVNNPVQMNEFIDAQMSKYDDDFSRVKQVRKSVFHSSMNRSLMITVVGIILLIAFVYTSINSLIFMTAFGVVIAIDMFGVSLNYLSTDEKYWVDQNEKKYPFHPTNTDFEILDNEVKLNPELGSLIAEAEKEKKAELRDHDLKTVVKKRIIEKERFAILNQNTNYRVFDFSGGFSSAKPSYYHKSLGGYHGAKLRVIQNVFEFHIVNSNPEIFNLLNVKYFVQPSNEGMVLRTNYGANGPVWFVSELKEYSSRYDEIRSLGQQFEIENVGKGILLIDNNVTQNKRTYGSESLSYVVDRDTFRIDLPNGVKEGMKVSFVMDANGVTNLVPAQTIELDSLSSFKSLVSIEVTHDFDSKKMASISKENLGSLQGKKFSNEGEIHLTKYSPMELEYVSNTDQKQFAVFSEVYYENNWKAYIDDKEVEIYNVDYLLRGLEIPEGEHDIKFIYSSSAYNTANIISFILCTIVLLFLGFSFWKEKKENGLVDEVSE